MTRKFLPFSLVILLLFFPFYRTVSQDSAPAPDITNEFRDNIYQLVDAFSHLQSLEDKENFMALLHPEVEMTITYIGVNDRLSTLNLNRKGIEAYVDYRIASEGIVIPRKIDEIYDQKIRGDIGIAVFRTSFEVLDGETTMRKGTQVTTLTQRKERDQWLFVRLQITELEDQRFKGSCGCELFAGTVSGDFIARTTVPQGTQYQTDMNYFAIRDKGDRKLIRVQEQTYEWKANGVIRTKEEGNWVELPGKAHSYRDAILIIMQERLYPENCTDIILRKE